MKKNTRINKEVRKSIKINKKGKGPTITKKFTKRIDKIVIKYEKF